MYCDGIFIAEYNALDDYISDAVDAMEAVLSSKVLVEDDVNRSGHRSSDGRLSIIDSTSGLLHMTP